ncbi:hypothetical protein D3C72_1622680 [compost metagenome]
MVVTPFSNTRSIRSAFFAQPRPSSATVRVSSGLVPRVTPMKNFIFDALALAALVTRLSITIPISIGLNFFMKGLSSVST